MAERDAATANGKPVQQRIHTLAGAYGLTAHGHRECTMSLAGKPPPAKDTSDFRMIFPAA